MSALFPVRLEQAEIRRAGRAIMGPITATIDDCGTVIVLGPNGSGKTSFLRALHGIERLSRGEIHWSGDNDAVRLKQSFVFQTPIMLRRSVLENLLYPLALKGESDTGRAKQWAARIGLDAALRQPATRLSGGEKQKLALARALITDPSVIFLDEPCANLDGRSTREIEEILIEAKASGTRIIMATHDLGQARRLADHILLFKGGALHENAEAKTFFDGPRTPEARAFLRGEIVE